MQRRTLAIVLFALALLGAGGYYFFQQQQAAVRAAATNRATATIARGTLVASVSAAGNIYAPQQTSLNFQLTGVPIKKINVKVGDAVKAGAVLAEVDDSDLQFQIRTAQSSLTSAQAKLDALKQPASQADLDAAQAQVTSAQANYNAAVAKFQSLKQGPTSADLNAAQAAVTSAKSAYDAAVIKNAHANDQITVARAALDKATVALQQAQAAYNTVAWRSDVGATSQSAALQQATIDYQSALANYNLAVTGINDSAVKSAAQALAQAQANLANLTKGPSASDLASAQSSIESAKQSQAQAQANVSKLTTPASAQDLAQAQAALDSAQTAFEQAKRKLDQAKIVAPFDGTIGSVNYVEGQLASTATAALTLVNLTNLQTQINLSEVDVAKVKTDQEVTLTFDALARRTFPGKIVSIAPVGTVTQGVVNYLVTVALTQPDPAIKPGMTAEATITVERRDNVLMVPNRAIRTQGTQRLMTLLFEGNAIPLIVQTGLSNDQNTEIIGAATAQKPVQLQEGDVVVLNATTTTTGGGTRGGVPGGLGVPGGGFAPGR